MNIAALTATIALSVLTGVAGQASAQGVIAYEGARIIVGDGRVLDNTTLVVSGAKIAQVGGTVPAGATRVNLAGKTVMPGILDTHNHLSQTREMLIDDLKRRAYYGVTAAQSMGQDTTNISFQIREETREGKIPGAARFFTAGRGITGVEPGRTMAPHWVTTVAEARQAVREEAAKKVDIIKFWVDDRNHTRVKLTPELYRPIVDEAHKLGFRAIAHVYYLDDAKELVRSGINGFAHLVRDLPEDDDCADDQRDRYRKLRHDKYFSREQGKAPCLERAFQDLYRFECG